MNLYGKVEIRQTNIIDEKGLVDFFIKAYGDDFLQYRYPDRWRWLYLNNPFIAESFGLPSWIALCDGRIIGHYGAMIVPCKIGSESLKAAWGVDAIVLPEYRKTGVGSLLMKADTEPFEIFMSLSMSDANQRIMEKQGAVPGPEADLFLFTNHLSSAELFVSARKSLHRFLREVPARIVWALTRWSGIPWLCTKYWQIRLKFRQKRKTSERKTGTLDFRRVNGRFGSEADVLWESCRDRYDFAVERSREYLNWKYIDQPGCEYECYTAYKGKDIAGIVVIRIGRSPEPRFGVIAEILGLNGDDERLDYEMAQFAFDLLQNHAPIGIYCASSATGLIKALKSLGFLQVASYSSWIFVKPRMTNQMKATGKWRPLLSKGDQDWDQYPSVAHPSISQVRKMIRFSRLRERAMEFTKNDSIPRS